MSEPSRPPPPKAYVPSKREAPDKPAKTPSESLLDMPIPPRPPPDLIPVPVSPTGEASSTQNQGTRKGRDAAPPIPPPYSKSTKQPNGDEGASEVTKSVPPMPRPPAVTRSLKAPPTQPNRPPSITTNKKVDITIVSAQPMASDIIPPPSLPSSTNKSEPPMPSDPPPEPPNRPTRVAPPKPNRSPPTDKKDTPTQGSPSLPKRDHPPSKPVRPSPSAPGANPTTGDSSPPYVKGSIRKAPPPPSRPKAPPTKPTRTPNVTEEPIYTIPVKPQKKATPPAHARPPPPSAPPETKGDTPTEGGVTPPTSSQSVPTPGDDKEESTLPMSKPNPPPAKVENQEVPPTEAVVTPPTDSLVTPPTEASQDNKKVDVIKRPKPPPKVNESKQTDEDKEAPPTDTPTNQPSVEQSSEPVRRPKPPPPRGEPPKTSAPPVNDSEVPHPPGTAPNKERSSSVSRPKPPPPRRTEPPPATDDNAPKPKPRPSKFVPDELANEEKPKVKPRPPTRPVSFTKDNSDESVTILSENKEPPPKRTPPLIKAPPPPVKAPPPDRAPPPVKAPPPDRAPPPVKAPPSDKTPPPVKAPPPDKTPPPVKAPPPDKTPPPVKAPPPDRAPPPVKAPPSDKTPPPVKAPPPDKTPPPVKAPPPDKTPPPVKAPPPSRPSAPSRPDQGPPPGRPKPPRPTEPVKNKPPRPDEPVKPSKSRSGPVPAKRNLKESDLPPPLPPRPEPGHPLYRYVCTNPHGIALNNKETSEYDELSYYEGDVIELIEKVDDYWYIGCNVDNDNQEGLILGKELKIIKRLPGQDKVMEDGPCAIAMSSFQKRSDDELSFKEGDLIMLISQIGDDWLRGQLLNGDQGIFPMSFVEIVEPLPPDAVETLTAATPEYDPPSGPYCIAVAKFADDTPQDLPFDVGDVIEITERIDDDWLRGKVNGLEGMFPQSFVNIMVDLPIGVVKVDEGRVDDSEGPNVATAIADYEGEESDLSFKEGDKITVLSRISDDWLYGQLNGNKGMFPSGFLDKVPDNLPLKEEESQPEVIDEIPITTVPTTGKCKAIYDYPTDTPGDLTFTVGEIITTTSWVNDEWINGRIGDREGMFPLTLVEIIEELPKDSIPTSKPTSIKPINFEEDDLMPKGRALRDFTSKDISFRTGDILLLLSKEGSNLYLGENTRTSELGEFPMNCVEVIVPLP